MTFEQFIRAHVATGIEAMTLRPVVTNDRVTFTLDGGRGGELLAESRGNALQGVEMVGELSRPEPVTPREPDGIALTTRADDDE